MKIYSITIEPYSAFGTPLKGDSLFGHFCWQAAYDSNLLKTPFSEAVSNYNKSPFAVFSTALPALADGTFALKRPDAPLELLFDLSSYSREELVGQRKDMKQNRWLVCKQPGAMSDLKKAQWLNDQKLAKEAGLSTDFYISQEELGHNSINRLTGTTTAGTGFAPYTSDTIRYAPGCKLALIVGINTNLLEIDSLIAGLERIGITGFGRDASTGAGKFKIIEHTEVNLAEFGSKTPNAIYTLAPSVPEPDQFKDGYFTPFTRFGRHGDRLAVTGKPYKNPVVMLDEGAVLFPNDINELLDSPYTGTGLTQLSKAQPEAISQGYSLYIPVQMEVL